jgi:hypothetical protein
LQTEIGTKEIARHTTSGLAKWRLSPLTVRGSQSHHAGQICETPHRQAAGALVIGKRGQRSTNDRETEKIKK